MERFRTWNEILMERLSNPEDVIGYLEVFFEEYLDDGDKTFFLKGIKNVIEAQGGVFSVSEQTGVDPKFLSDAINNGSMPPFHILNSILTFFGGTPLNDLQPDQALLLGSSGSRRMVSRQISDQMVLAESSFRRRTVNERQLQNIRYWTELRKHLKQRDSRLSLTPKASHYRDLKIGTKGFSLRARQTIKRKEISASLVMKGANAIGHFYSLRVQEEEIERDFGDKLEWWARAKSEKRVAFRNQEADPSDEKDWPHQHEWLGNTLEKLYHVFHPRIERLTMEM